MLGPLSPSGLCFRCDSKGFQNESRRSKKVFCDAWAAFGLLPKFSTQLNSFGASVRGLWSTSAKSNAAAVAKIVDLTRRRDRLIPLGGG